MTYCISDIHGYYDIFMRLLESIGYSDTDRLIVCGDFLDKGTNSIRLAKTIFALPNAYCIKGNHEHQFFKFYCSKTDNPPTDFDCILADLQNYFPHDGHLLDWDTIEILVDLPYYFEESEFVCVHAGAPLDAEDRIIPLKRASPEYLVYDRTFKDPSILPVDSKCVFFGHTPTIYIQGKPQILTYPKPGGSNKTQTILDFCKVHLDTGIHLSGTLGCFCVETCHSYYVTK